MPRLLSLIILSFLSAVALAGVHKWVDPDGTVHYSDQPPPSTVNEQTLDIKSATRPGDSGDAGTDGAAKKAKAPKTYIEQDAEFRKRQAEAEEKRQKDEIAQAKERERQVNCEHARASVSGLQVGGRLVGYKPNGERYFLDDNQRAQEIDSAQKSVDTWCNPPKQ